MAKPCRRYRRGSAQRAKNPQRKRGEMVGSSVTPLQRGSGTPHSPTRIQYPAFGIKMLILKPPSSHCEATRKDGTFPTERVPDADRPKRCKRSGTYGQNPFASLERPDFPFHFVTTRSYSVVKSMAQAVTSSVARSAATQHNPPQQITKHPTPPTPRPSSGRPAALPAPSPRLQAWVHTPNAPSSPF